MAQTLNERKGKDWLLKVGNELDGNAVTFTDATNQVGITAHGLSVGELVRFSAVVTTTAVVIDTDYFVLSVVDADNITISATEGGAIIDIDADGTGTSAEAFQRVGGLRSATLSYANTEIDVTNQDSGQIRQLLDEAGIQTVSLSGDGVGTNRVSLDRAFARAQSQKVRNWRMCQSSTEYFQGCFKTTSFEYTGSFDGAQEFSMSLENSGAITYTNP